MSTFKERLAIEKEELDVKIGKLRAFIDSNDYQKINPYQMSMLNIQLHAMMTYSQCLLERIVWLEEEIVV